MIILDSDSNHLIKAPLVYLWNVQFLWNLGFLWNLAICNLRLIIGGYKKAKESQDPDIQPWLLEPSQMLSWFRYAYWLHAW